MRYAGPRDARLPLAPDMSWMGKTIAVFPTVWYRQSENHFGSLLAMQDRAPSSSLNMAPFSVEVGAKWSSP